MASVNAKLVCRLHELLSFTNAALELGERILTPQANVFEYARMATPAEVCVSAPARVPDCKRVFLTMADEDLPRYESDSDKVRA